MRSDYELFVNDPARKDKYRQAIRLLQEAGVQHVLLELSTSVPVPLAAEGRLEAAATLHFETLGYQKCLADLFRLEEMAHGAKAPVVPDFGAIDSMLADGSITPKQAELLRRGDE